MELDNKFGCFYYLQTHIFSIKQTAHSLDNFFFLHLCCRFFQDIGILAQDILLSSLNELCRRLITRTSRTLKFWQLDDWGPGALLLATKN